MISALRFVQGAVSKKDFIPAMGHFVIENGRIRSFNGVLSISSPIEFSINCKPKACDLIQAISRCEEGSSANLSITKAGRLKIESGKFKAFIDLLNEETPDVSPEGDVIELNEQQGRAILQGFKKIVPFIGNDASRPWANGALLQEGSIFATNNVVIIQCWLDIRIPTKINIPSVAIKEVLRINLPPIKLQCSETSATFHFEDNRWIRFQLLSSEWPDIVKILETPSNPVPISDDLFEALEALKPFTNKLGQVLFKDGIASTDIGENESGATYQISNTEISGIYRYEMLSLLNGVITSADMTLYPKPCLFFGSQLRGAIIGMRA